MKEKKELVQIGLDFMKRSTRDHVSAYAAQSAYFLLLAVIPFILLLMTLVQYTPISQDMLENVLLNIVPSNFETFVEGIISEVYSKSLAAVPITALTTLYAAGKGLMGLTNGLNTIHQVKETRGYFASRFLYALYTLLVIVMIVTTMTLLVFGNTIRATLLEHFTFIGEIWEELFEVRRSLSLVILSLVFLVLYKVLPNRKITFRSQLPGAVISAMAWSVFSLFFSIYLDYFNALDMYGSLTTIIMIMLWMYFCMFIFLLGAEINSYFEENILEIQASLQPLEEVKPGEEDHQDNESNGERIP